MIIVQAWGAWKVLIVIGQRQKVAVGPLMRLGFVKDPKSPIAGSVDPAPDAAPAWQLDVAPDVAGFSKRNPARGQREGFHRMEARHGSQPNAAAGRALLDVRGLSVGDVAPELSGGLAFVDRFASHGVLL